MLSVAMGLISKPNVLLIDEASLGLSPIVSKELFKTVEKINQRGVAILLVEQEAALALKIASRGYVMAGGKIIIEGPSSKLLANDEVRKAYLGVL
mgnify:CR=1 FL=1